MPFSMSLLRFLQGELAHRLVKRLYGLTNKQDAPEQIGRRYRQARYFDKSESQDFGGDSFAELHHSIGNSRNKPVQLASLSSSGMQDPAAKVDIRPF